MPVSWNIRPPATPSAELIALTGGFPLVAQLLAQRGFTTPLAAQSFLNPTFYQPTPPTALIGVEVAAEKLHEAIRNKQKILVWGDFDVDGQTSTSLLVAALRKLAGHDQVQFHVPNRFSESHGMRLPKLREKLENKEFRPQVVLTCDTGITDAEAIAYAKAQGVTVIITDHHDLPAEFANLTPGQDALWGLGPQAQPMVRQADAIVNPKLQPANDPLRTLPGVGVAYKLIQHLYALAGRGGEEHEFLDLVALGIVADVAEQVHDARYLLQIGLEKLRTTKRIGLLALMEIARLDPATVTADSIGFQLGPRMNALGRLEDATVAVELLTTRDVIRASQLANKMERLNQERRLLTSQITKAALEMLEREPSLLDYNGLVLAHEAWHAGIVGIVASRLVEEVGKPAVLLIKEPGQPARGSARSIPGVDIGAAIAACSPLLLTYGGHPGAAGVSLLPENIDRFRRELDRQIDLHRDEAAPSGLQIDLEANLGSLNLDLAGALQQLAPFGNGNPTPQFLSRHLTVRSDHRLGREGAHRKLQVQGPDGAQQSVIWFHGGDAELPTGPIDLVYTLGINDYRGERTVQLSLVAIRPAELDTTQVSENALPTTRTIHDLRGAPIQLAALPSPAQARWYAEGNRLGDEQMPIDFAPRSALATKTNGSPLVLWSVPPSASLLNWLLKSAEPETIYLCGQLTSDDTMQAVVRQVASMCKYALGRDGLLHIDRMAARLGLTERAIRQSLLWLDRRGLITIVDWETSEAISDVVQIGPGGGERQAEEADLLQAELEAELAEIRAYRRYFLRARVNELIPTS